MWREADLAFPDDLGAVACSIIPAHPWVYGLGQLTENGAYLSPTNAIAYLAKKLAGLGGDAHVTIFMAAADSHNDFMGQLSALTGVFPAPAFTQVARLAKSAAELATVKMQLPAKGAAGLPPVLPLSVPSTRTALNAMRAAAAQADAAAGTSIEKLIIDAQGFAAERSRLLDDIRSGLDELKQKRARAWVFTATGNVATTMLEMLKNIPQPAAVYSVAMMFVGDNLDALRGMIHDVNVNAGAEW